MPGAVRTEGGSRIVTSLAKTAAGVGAALVVVHLPLIVCTARVAEWCRRFPRHRVAGWLLSAAALTWAATLLYHTSLGRFDVYKPALYVLTPVAYGLIVTFMDELLAPRALGGLLLLFPAPVLDVARWNGSAWRLVVVVLAYVCVCAGVALVMGPYHFRKLTTRLLASERRGRLAGWAGVAVGLLLLVLAFTVY